MKTPFFIDVLDLFKYFRRMDVSPSVKIEINFYLLLYYKMFILFVFTAYIGLINSFITPRNVLFRNKLFCSNNNTGEIKQPISIKSITELFNSYLQEEMQNITLSMPIPTIIKNANITNIYEHPSSIEVPNNTLLNIKKYKLLSILRNNKTADIVKLAHIDYNEWLFDNDIKLSNGGLMKDWDTIL
jgi:hypothetical protein